MYKRKMIQKLTGPNAISASALSKQVDASQVTLSKWLREAGNVPSFYYPNKTKDTIQMGQLMSNKRPNDWSPEEKLKVVLEADNLPDEQLGAFLRSKGLHETNLQQWRLQMLHGLGKPSQTPKPKGNKSDTKKIRALEKELRRKDKALAETAALLVLKKKVQEIWGDEDDDTVGKNGK
jgi:transposase-like protein